MRRPIRPVRIACRARSKDVRAEKLEEAKVSKVIFDTSASPDGFAIASGVRLEEPMSDSGEELHGWERGGGRASGRLAERIRAP